MPQSAQECPSHCGFRLGIYVFKDAEIVDFAAPSRQAPGSLGVVGGKTLLANWTRSWFRFWSDGDRQVVYFVKSRIQRQLVLIVRFL